MTVSKSEIIAKVAASSGASARDVRSIVDSLLSEISASLTSGDAVSLGGFGSFILEQVPAPANANRVRIKASMQPKFKPGKALKDAVQ